MILDLVCVSPEQHTLAKELADSLSASLNTSQASSKKPYLDLSEDGLAFFHPAARSRKKLLIDFNSGASRWRIERASHEKLIKKALGRSDAPLNILDCTAGLLQDTLVFLSLGHRVTALEQSRIMFHLLEDAIHRSEDSSIFKNLDLINEEACSYIREVKNIDVVYFDPMYPKTKKSALSSGQLEYLEKVLEVESVSNNAAKEFEVLQSIPKKKLIVKRPIKAEPFSQELNYQVFGKTTRFDVYL